MKELIQKIMLKAYQITQKGKYQIFVRYSGHVNNLEVCYYNDGLWDSPLKNCHENKRNKILDVYLDGENAEKELIKALAKLDKMYEEE